MPLDVMHATDLAIDFVGIPQGLSPISAGGFLGCCLGEFHDFNAELFFDRVLFQQERIHSV